MPHNGCPNRIKLNLQFPRTPGFCAYNNPCLVIVRLLRVSQIENNTRVRLSSATLRELFAEINGPVETQTAVLVDVNVQRLEISRRVDDTDVPGLHEVVGDDDVLLVRRDFDIVGTNCGLLFIRVIQTLNVVQVADVQSGDVVSGGQGEVDETAVLGDIGAWMVLVTEASMVCNRATY